MADEQELVISCLKNILVDNQQLTHLDISGTGLTQLIIESILPFVKDSPSLTSIHLSNNPAIT